MTIDYKGPFIRIVIKPNELKNNRTEIRLTSGYTFERIFIHYAQNIEELVPYMNVCTCSHITFPVVNSKSPMSLPLYIPDLTEQAEIRFTIEKFGQIPDPNYFKSNITPILVTGADGKKYGVIPSDQFK